LTPAGPDEVGAHVEPRSALLQTSIAVPRRAAYTIDESDGATAIASVGSAVALMIFLLVGAAGWRRRADTGSNPAIVLLAIGVTAVVLGFFAVDTWQNAPQTFVAIVAILVLAVVLDAWTRRSVARGAPETGAQATV